MMIIFSTRTYILFLWVKTDFNICGILYKQEMRTPITNPHFLGSAPASLVNQNPSISRMFDLQRKVQRKKVQVMEDTPGIPCHKTLPGIQTHSTTNDPGPGKSCKLCRIDLRCCQESRIRNHLFTSWQKRLQGVVHFFWRSPELKKLPQRDHKASKWFQVILGWFKQFPWLFDGKRVKTCMDPCRLNQRLSEAWSRYFFDALLFRALEPFIWL